MIATSHRTPVAGGARFRARPELVASLTSLFALAIALVVPAQAQVPLRPAGAPLGARLIASDATGVTFEVDVPAPQLTAVEAPNGRWQRLEIEGYASDARIGAPLLPAASLWLATPEGATVTVVGSGEGERVYEGVRLLPQQELLGPEAGGSAVAPPAAVEASGRLGRELIEDPAVYARSGSSAEVVTLAGIAHLRAQRVARVTLRPAAWDAAAGRLRVWSRLRVRVDFGGVAPAAPGEPLGTSVPPTVDAFESIYASTLLNYESGKAWRRDLQAGSLRRLGLAPNAAPARPGVTASLLGGARQDFSASSNWVRIAVPTKGMYRLEPADLAIAGANLANLDPRTIRLFVKPGLPMLDEKVAPSGWLSEVAIDVVGEADGRLDPTDYIVFFGLGASGWRDDYGVPGSVDGWLNHPYEPKNVYWLTWDAAFVDPPHRWSSRGGAPEMPAAFETPDFPARQHFENDFFYLPDLQEGGLYHAYVGTFWEKWAWLKINDGSGTVQLTANTPGAVATRPARLRARLWGNSRELFGGLADHYLNVSFNNVVFGERAFYGLNRQDYDTTFVGLAETNNRFAVFCRDVDPNPNSARRDEVALFWYELDYAKRLRPANNQLEFRSPDTTGAVGYGLGPFSQTAGFGLLDTSDPLAPQRITGYVERDTTDGKAIYFHDDVAARRSYFAYTAANLRRPDAIQRVAIDDLVAPSNGADYVVLTYDGFIDAATRLAQHRAGNLPSVPNARTRVVKISDVYAWYSGGRTDPVAIRNFVYDAVKNAGWSPAPSYLCLFGDASYDFKDILRVAQPGQPPALVPGYVNGFQTRQFLTDDWLVDLDLGVTEPYPGDPVAGLPDSALYDLPDLVVGRLPVANATEAAFLVDQKIIPYDSSPAWGEWRSRALLLADDLTQGADPDPLSSEHLEATETISRGFLPPAVEQRKVYMLRYPFGSGTEKPAVNRDVKATVNEGVLLWNYIGHGNPFKMADENAFILSDVSTLVNIDKPTFVIAASCDLGKFDDPVTTGLGESLLKSTAGGAIAAFSASDIAFAFANKSLAQELFQRMFDEYPDGFTRPLGSAVLAAKLRQSSLSVNDLKYTLMGDPGMRLAMPDHQVRMVLLDDETDAPLDTLRRGRRVRVEGELHSLHDPNVSSLMGTYNGQAAILVTDSPPRDTVQGSFRPVGYTYDPGTVFRGDVPVQNGKFEAVFIMPLESIAGPGGAVRAYVSGGPSDGGGALLRGVAPGSPAVVDTIGPTIGLSFTSGTLEVPPDATLRVFVRDENGVLLTGHTLPNALYLTIDGVTRYDLTKDFRYESGSYQQGTVEFALPGLDPGAHSIVVSAADNYAQGLLARRNRSTASIDFEVIEGSTFTLGRVYNFPNPFAPERGTTFVLAGLNEAARVMVKIHTVSGGLVRALSADAVAGQTQIFWDGTDAQGDRLANGAYIYQVEAQGTTSGTVTRYRGQLAVLR